MDRYDIIAIGGGAAGLVTAAGAAGLGARAALIERHRMGGECLWTGCVPSKALIAAARALSDVRGAARFGINASVVSVDFQRVMKHVHDARAKIAPHDSPARFRSLGVDVIAGSATFLDPRTVQVGTRRLQARHVVVATGSRPTVPPIPGLGDVDYLTNENVFEIDELPDSLVVLGGGAVGIELAQAFAILGSRVTVLESDDRILRTEDAEIVEQMNKRLDRDGVAIKTGVKVTRVEKAGATIRLHTSGGEFQANALLVATGRTPNTDTLGLDVAGVRYNERGLELDDYLRTNVAGIWGAGDVTGAPRFTHVADYHARLILRNALFPGRSRADYTTVPWSTYTDPEIGHIGLTETQARDRHGDVQVFRKALGELDRGVADGVDDGMLKIIANKRGEILGAHVLGRHASTLLGELTLAIKHKITLANLASTMKAYPTYPESIKQVGDAFVRTGFTGWKQKITARLVGRVR